MNTKVIQGLIPNNGWHYMQDGKYRVESDCFSNLVKAVELWRISNGRPIDNPVKDIEEYICGNWPRNCNQGSSPIHSVNIIDRMSPNTQRMVDKISFWAMDKLKVAGIKTLESQQEASRRGSICIQCPMNKAWEHECGPCVTHAQRFLAVIRQGREAERYNKLHACKVIGHCNRTAVWLNMEHVDKPEGRPANCWVK